MRSRVRAYSHQGHGPRAEQQAGYISATSDGTPSVAKGSRSIHEGQIERLPPPGPSARYAIRQETAAGAHGKGRNAPVTAIRGKSRVRCGFLEADVRAHITMSTADCDNVFPSHDRVERINDLGMINWEHGPTRSQMSTTSDSTSAHLQQTIDDLQRQLAERTAERDEALGQQAATAEVLGLINSSPGDLAPVFDAMLEKAMRLCEAALGTLRTFDGEFFHLVAARGDYPIERLRQLGPIPSRGFFERIARGERVVHVADLRETDWYRDNPEARERTELGGTRTWLAVALHKYGVVRGAIVVYRQEVRPFTDKQIALLENFAAQA